MPEPSRLSPSVEPPVVSPNVSTNGTWLQRLGSVLFIIFCFELGLLLLIFPWTGAWADNYFSWALPGPHQVEWHDWWNNGYVRGAVSGLGVVNLWIAVAEVFRMFARRHAREK